MIYKTLILTLLVFGYEFSYSQTDLNCQLLKILLANKEARVTFKLDKHSELPIIFVDTERIFKSCNFPQYYGRSVQLSNDPLISNQKDPSYIVLSNFIKKNKYFKIEIFQRYTGARGYVEFKKRKAKIILSKFQVGYI